MKKFKRYFRSAVYYLFSYFPTRLPIGLTEYKKWAEDVIRLSGVPYNDSTVFALSAFVLHAEERNVRFKSKQFYARIMRKGATNEVAHFVMMDLKAKQVALEAANKKNMEATANLPGGDLGQQERFV